MKMSEKFFGKVKVKMVSGKSFADLNSETLRKMSDEK